MTRLWAAVVAAAVAVLGTGCASTETASVTARGVCAGVSSCRLVARADVDGDGRADQIGWAHRRHASRVVILVSTADGERIRKRLDVSVWFNSGAWGGAAAVDGRRGAELLVGTSMGAHTPGYTMLTYRHGALVVEPSPSVYGDVWYVDAAYSVDLGWKRSAAHGRVLLHEETALRDGARRTFAGTTTTYAWRSGHWVKTGKARRHYDNAHRAGRIAGWHVPGLARFPGV